MNHSEEKRIQKKKRTGYNIYGIRDSLFYLLAALACAVILIALADLMVSGWPLMTRVVLYVAILAAAAAAAVAFGKSSQAQVEAYRRQEGFEFIGLYDLADAQLTDSSDILSREEGSALSQRCPGKSDLPADRDQAGAVPDRAERMRKVYDSVFF